MTSPPSYLIGSKIFILKSSIAFSPQVQHSKKRKSLIWKIYSNFVSNLFNLEATNSVQRTAYVCPIKIRLYLVVISDFLKKWGTVPLSRNMPETAPIQKNRHVLCGPHFHGGPSLHSLPEIFDLDRVFQQ